MRKPVALILIVLLSLSMLHIHRVSASEIKYASITGISLPLGGSVQLGPYTVKFTDASLTWDSVYLTVEGPDGQMSAVLKVGGSLAYPSSDPTKMLLNVSVLWIRSDTKSVLLTISSPLTKLYSDKAIPVGTEFSLPSGFPPIKIKLVSTSDTDATFTVTMPYGATYTLEIPKGESRSISYKLDEIHTYVNYLSIEVLNTTKNSGAVINLYVPRVASTTLKITTPGETNPENPITPVVKTTLLYDDIIYVGERLPVKYNGTTYYFKLLSVIPDMARVEVYTANETYANYTLEAGDVPKAVPGTPFLVAISKTQPDYKRAILKVYGPIEAQVIPILRSAKVVANITAVPKKVLLGQDIVLSIGVENLGRGDAYKLNVAAPIPNGFQLVSMTKSWQINNLPAFTKLPMLVYVLRPTKVGKFDIGKVLVTYYDDQSLETGKMKTVYSAPLTNIEVYAVPKLSLNALAYNGTWSNYVTAKVNDTITLALTLQASKGDPAYEFIKNATLILSYPKSLKGQSVINLGTIRAGETKTVKVPLRVMDENLSLVKATLRYLDPLGNQHELSFGTVATINSVPPEVVVKTVKVWPKPEELPAYINQTLANVDNATPIAEQILDVVSPYVPKKSNPWKPLAVIFIIVTLVLAGVSYNYWRELEALKEKVLRKKQRRPGGLPKKEEEESEIELL
ncbi:BatD family protein [Thermococcus sp.]|uniref:BatD family protein n=1 Tax=Thermococcus sp. TaxID=35749 RepID=UPI00260272E2|nr:BatD family protein [Thermococcus sp.]